MRRTLVAGTVAALLVGVAGCADEPRPRIAEPTATASATGSPSDGPSDDPEVETGPPELPDEARQPTPDGAVAFTKYFWDVANYSQKSGDTSVLEGIVNDGCQACQGAIRFVRQTSRPGYAVSGGETTVRRARAETFSPSAGRTGAAVAFDLQNTKQTVSRNGQVLDTYKAGTVSSRFLLLHTRQGWRVDVWTFED